MKKVLSIAIVICLAVTMTCSSFAVEVVGTVDELIEAEVVPEADSTNGSLCLKCMQGSVISSSKRTDTLVVGDYSCTHCAFGYDHYVRYQTYQVDVCTNCGTIETLINDVLEITCYGFDYIIIA